MATAKETLKETKATATKAPARKGKKAPTRKTTRQTKAKSRTATSEPAAETTTRATSASATRANATPTIDAELVHAPVSGSGINGLVRGDIAQTDPQTMAQALVAVQHQQNTVLISQANKKLDKEVAVDQGLGLQVELEQEKNATINESIQTQAMKTRQQGAKTSIEGVKLQGLNIDLEGEAALLPHRQEGWAIKSEEMIIDNDGARALLPLRKEHWSAKLQLAQVGLQKLNLQIQQAQSELYAPVSITQETDY